MSDKEVVHHMKSNGIQIMRPNRWYSDMGMGPPVIFIDRPKKEVIEKLSLLERYNNWIKGLRGKGWKI